MKQVIAGQVERISMIQQILLAGMQVRVIIRVLKRLTQDHFILHIMRVMGALRKKLTEKSNGS